MTIIEVTLTATEYACGAQCGIQRHISSLMKNLNINKFPASPEKEVLKEWSIDIEGALSEMATAKHYEVYWEPTNGTFKASDLPGVQIRSTTHDKGHLITRPNDNDWWRPYILVIAPKRTMTFSIVGWMILKDTKKHEFWRGDSWWVHKDQLNDMADFDMDHWRDYERSRTYNDRAGGADDLGDQRSGGSPDI